MKLFPSVILLVSLLVLSGTAAAQDQCSGFATKESFTREMKLLAGKFQANDIEFRKLESQLPLMEAGRPIAKEQGR